MQIQEINFEYCLDIRTHQSLCHCGEQYCACKTIEHTEVKAVNCVEIAKRICEYKKTKDVMDLYCVERILNIHKISGDNFRIDIGRGYYGEEVEGAYLCQYIDGNSKLIEKIEFIFTLKNFKEKIEYVLTEEYGYVLSALANKNYSITGVQLQNITFPQKEYACKVSRENQAFNTEKIPQGVLLEDNGTGYYRVIDGYHRILRAKADNKRTILVIVAS